MRSDSKPRSNSLKSACYSIIADILRHFTPKEKRAQASLFCRGLSCNITPRCYYPTSLVSSSSNMTTCSTPIAFAGTVELLGIKSLFMAFGQTVPLLVLYVPICRSQNTWIPAAILPNPDIPASKGSSNHPYSILPLFFRCAIHLRLTSNTTRLQLLVTILPSKVPLQKLNNNSNPIDTPNTTPNVHQ
jgi:hypothetical protein